MTEAQGYNPVLRRASSSMSESITRDNQCQSSEDTFDKNYKKRESSDSSTMRTHVVPYLEHNIVVDQLKKELDSNRAEFDSSLEHERNRKLYYKGKAKQMAKVNSDLMTYLKQLSSQYSSLLHYTQNKQEQQFCSVNRSEVALNDDKIDVDFLVESNINDAIYVDDDTETHVSSLNEDRELNHENGSLEQNLRFEEVARNYVTVDTHDDKNHSRGSNLSVSSGGADHELPPPPPPARALYAESFHLSSSIYDDDGKKDEVSDKEIYAARYGPDITIPGTISLALPRRRSSLQEIPLIQKKLSTSSSTPNLVPQSLVISPAHKNDGINEPLTHMSASRTRRSSMFMNPNISSLSNSSVKSATAHQKKNKSSLPRKSYTSNTSSNSSHSMRWIPPSLIRGPPGAA